VNALNSHKSRKDEKKKMCPRIYHQIIYFNLKIYSLLLDMKQ